MFGGDLWQPNIDNLEIGLWLFSWTGKESSSRLADRRERLAPFAYSALPVTYKINCFYSQKKTILQQNLNHFWKAFAKMPKTLSAEPNGKEFLSCLGDIYISEAKAFLNKFSIALIVL